MKIGEYCNFKMNIMKWKYAFFPAILSFFFSCNNGQQDVHEKKSPAVKSELNCYRYIKNKDTVILKIKTENDLVNGTLIYNLYEKDKNTGTIDGKMDGEILLADYTFNSEGTTSVRPVAFKKSGNNFIEGFGETENKNGKAAFKNKDSLHFDHSFILIPFDCNK
jgi:hypothetical protein